MPKQSFNIIDFSGGINKVSDKRDLEDNQFVHSDGFMNYSPGKLTLDGTLSEIPGLSHSIGSFPDQYSAEGIPNLYYFNPEMGFRVFMRVTVTAGAGTNEITCKALTADIAYHGLDVGAKLLIINSDVSTQNGFFISVSEIVNINSFKAAITETTTTANQNMWLVLNAYYDANVPFTAKHSSGYFDNRYLFKATQYGKFGFYAIGENRYWYGRSDEVSSELGTDPWYFDTRYTWDFHQNGDTLAQDALVSNTKVFDLFYDDGVIRTCLEPPKKWSHGFCKRPVGLYSIDRERTLFIPNDSDGTVQHPKSYIAQGWYPLRTHILSPGEYHHSRDYLNTSINYNGAGQVEADPDADSIADFQSTIDDPTGVGYDVGGGLGPYQFSLGVSHGNNSVDGDWQFVAGNEHAQLGFGISLLYDAILEVDGMKESTVSQLYASEGQKTVVMTGDSAENDQALWLYWKIYVGENLFTPLASDLIDSTIGSELSTGNDIISVGEFRGSGSESGNSNFRKWNPRVVGANIYMTDTNDGALDDPIWLATINFYANKDTHGRSVSHDGIESSAWSKTTATGTLTPGVVNQMIAGIVSVPTATFSSKNGYYHNENINAWYKTAAIVNRRLYAGNVAYFEDNVQTLKENPSGDQVVPKHFPDKVLISPTAKFDILPASRQIEAVRADGQDIVKLIGFGQNLLMFKHDDLIILDCSGEYETVTAVYKGFGVVNPVQICSTPTAHYWINSQGLYGLDAENPAVNLLAGKINLSEWIEKIWNIYSHIAYDPQENNVLIFTRYKGYPNNNIQASKVFIYNIDTDSIFYKQSIGTVPITKTSTGVLANSKVYVSTSNGDNDIEYLNVLYPNDHVVSRRAKVVYTYQITNGTGFQGQMGGVTKYLMIRKNGTWTKINHTNHPFQEVTGLYTDTSAPNDTELTTAANLTIANYENFCNNTEPNNTDYEHSISYILNGEGHADYPSINYLATVVAKEPGTAYSMSGEILTGDGAEYGRSGYAFSSDGTEGNIIDTDIAADSFVEVENTTGINFSAGKFRLFADRNGSTIYGVAYRITITYGTNQGNDAFESHTVNATYITGDPVANGYIPDPGTSNYAVDSTNQQLMINLREFLRFNPIILHDGSSVDLKTHFSFGAVTADGDGSKTGEVGLYYFNMTIREESPWSAFPDINIECGTSSGTSGHMTRWENNQSSNLNMVHLETKDYDFEQPNVRKKLYKAHITYKTTSYDDYIKVYHQANQNGTWTASTVEGATNAGRLNSSSTVNRATVSFGSDGNNVYSFALKFESDVPIRKFEINDISFIYRMKRPK